MDTDIKNANDLLTSDHRGVEAMYEGYKSASGKEREKLAQRIITSLTVHAALEEEFYYPELLKAGEKEMVAEYQAEHEAVKGMLGKLSMMPMDNEEHAGNMKAMMESVLHHAEEEEREAMPKMAEVIGEEKLAEMLPKMVERKKELEESTIKRLWASL